MELISREEAIKCLDGNVLITRQSEAEAVREYFEMVIKRLENLPTTDLVRCGECKYYEESEYIEGDMSCKYHMGHTYYTEDDRFCSYGERSE